MEWLNGISLRDLKITASEGYTFPLSHSVEVHTASREERERNRTDGDFEVCGNEGNFQ